MLLNLLFTEPLIFIAVAMGMIIAITVHEFSHALASTLMGDPTARDQGRLTLNPGSHLNFLGSIMLLVAGFGWGNPVPYNPYNLRFQRWGAALVALAGPISNLVIVVISSVFLRVIFAYQIISATNLLAHFLEYLIFINLMLAVFNMIPIPPLDGSKLLFGILNAPKYERFKVWLSTRGPFLLIILIIADSLFALGIFSRIFGAVLNIVGKMLF